MTEKTTSRKGRTARAVCLTTLLLALAPLQDGTSFTQSGGLASVGFIAPMGHEWLTRLAALELLGGDRIIGPDGNDPRKAGRGWTKGLAKNTDLRTARSEADRIRALPVDDDRYESTYKPVFDAIIGERWVDIGGFNVLKSKAYKYNPFNVIAQEPAAVQYDHFIRRYNDSGPRGGVDAAKRSQQRFKDYFTAAATAPGMEMIVWDGGALREAQQVNSNYFLFGRAVHLFQDAFSLEHVVRTKEDNYEKIRQVKSYLCALGTEQHATAMREVVKYESGDVIWDPKSLGTSGWESYKPGNMKAEALVALEATKDLWAAFIRVMAKPAAAREAAARAEAQTLVDNWLSFDEAEMLAWYDNNANRDESYVLEPGENGRGVTQDEAMKKLGYPGIKQRKHALDIEFQRRYCIFNLEPVRGYEDLWDPHLKIPYYWQWKTVFMKSPPKDWEIPDGPPARGTRVRLRNAATGAYLTAPKGVSKNEFLHVKKEGRPLDFILVGGNGNAVFRVADAPLLFLGSKGRTGAVRFESAPAAFAVEKTGTRWTVRHLDSEHLLWAEGELPFVSKKGDKASPNAQWMIEGLEGG